jgi:phage head maturation protease
MTIKEIVEKKAELISLKKAEIKTVKGGLTTLVNNNFIKVDKTVNDSENKLERTIVGNTYMWMDSHDDVHAKGVFTKSIKERKNQIFHLHDHEFKLTAKVGEPKEVYEKELLWSEFGVNKAGSTTALLMDSEIYKDYNSKIFNAYKNGQISQHSVGMQYVKIDLAVKDEDYEEEYKTWQDNIENIGNKELAEEKGYFWLVREAKLIEISAVLLGSNTLTPTLENKEAVIDTSKQEPSDDTHKLVELLTKIKF